jgi:hypothetical protein
MGGLTREQRNRLADKLPGTANLALGTLTLGQALTDQMSFLAFASGFGLGYC